jgi:flagellar motor switch protein FliN
MSEQQPWIRKLEAEIARELGQPVALTEGGGGPEGGEILRDTIEIPGATLSLAADGNDVGLFLVEARVIEAGQADAEMVRELWSGILASVAGRMGGKAHPGIAEGSTAASAAGSTEGPARPCALRLGSASVRLRLAVDAAEETGAAIRPPAQAAAAIPAPPVPARPMEHPAGNFDLLLEVELDASVRFGSREMELKELLELGPGDVVELDRHVADPVDLIVGDRIVARGEVVLVNGNFGLRVTEVAEPVRRLESIRCLW